MLCRIDGWIDGSIASSNKPIFSSLSFRLMDMRQDPPVGVNCKDN